MASELRVSYVPRNIGDEMKIMGTPVGEILALFGLPLFIWSLLRLSRLDTLVPFVWTDIYLSSFILWVCTPVAVVFFMLYKRANPKYDLMGHAVYAMFPKYYGPGVDVEYRPYLIGAVRGVGAERRRR
jgi:hypothetical protein